MAVDQNGDPWPDDEGVLSRVDPHRFGDEQLVVTNFAREEDSQRMGMKISVLTNAATQNGKPLVILIDGFNNDYLDGEAAYTEMRTLILQTRPAPYVFLQFYWDGLFDPNNDRRGFPTKWQKAVTILSSRV
jgi:hypothetical protein